ncbi:ROK family transcriptional regulator [Inquilinus sp. OTU3971]|uniref:ROK family transcriptional regulator n=1 Tax=Inquilinus sp. OTU3971 TaxID=3043855 RepID=UPI00313D307D
MAIGNNSGKTRSYNRRVVLETVRLQGTVSRTEIARRTALTTQAVSNITAALLAEGLLRNAGRRRSGRGQPPIEYEVNPDGGFTIGVEIAPRFQQSVLVNLAGRILARRTSVVDDPTPAAIGPCLRREIDALLASAGVTRAAILGAGVVMPGPFGIEGLSSVGPTAMPGWLTIDAAAFLGEAIGMPVLVENDATAAAVGERLHGVARDLRDFCLVHFGTGIGLGLVLGGQPYTGAFGNAGELGHVTVEPRGRPCPCGGRGCLERYASLHSLAEQLGGAADVDAPIRDGDPRFDAWVEIAAEKLLIMVGMLENLFDPEAIVFGGRLPDAVLDRLIARIGPLPNTVSHRCGRSVPRLLRGTTGELTPALGAAALPVFETVTPDFGAVLRARDTARDTGGSSHARR